MWRTRFKWWLGRVLLELSVLACYYFCLASVLWVKGETPLPGCEGPPKIWIQPSFWSYPPQPPFLLPVLCVGVLIYYLWVLAPMGFFPRNSRFWYHYFASPHPAPPLAEMQPPFDAFHHLSTEVISPSPKPVALCLVNYLTLFCL